MSTDVIVRGQWCSDIRGGYPWYQVLSRVYPGDGRVYLTGVGYIQGLGYIQGCTLSPPGSGGPASYWNAFLYSMHFSNLGNRELLNFFIVDDLAVYVSTFGG